VWPTLLGVPAAELAPLHTDSAPLHSKTGPKNWTEKLDRKMDRKMDKRATWRAKKSSTLGARFHHASISRMQNVRYRFLKVL
jgi:hypothetical protein